MGGHHDSLVGKRLALCCVRPGRVGGTLSALVLEFNLVVFTCRVCWVLAPCNMYLSKGTIVEKWECAIKLSRKLLKTFRYLLRHIALQGTPPQLAFAAYSHLSLPQACPRHKKLALLHQRFIPMSQRYHSLPGAQLAPSIAN